MLRLFVDPLRQHSIVRACAASMLFVGFAAAATGPFQSLVGIKVLGLSNLQYSLVAFLGAVSNVLFTIGCGLYSDRSQRFRVPMLVVSALGALGFGAIWAVPSRWVFALGSIGPCAIFFVLNALIFASIRNHAEGMSTRMLSDSITVVRMMISLSWVVVPGLVGAVLAHNGSAMSSYGIACIMAMITFVLILCLMPRDARHGRGDAPAPRPAMAETSGIGPLLNYGVLLRVGGAALVVSVLYVNGILLPLLVTGQGGGTVSDVGVILGMVAAIEVALMLVWAWLGRWLDQIAGLMIAALIYAAYFGCLANVHAPWEAYTAAAIGGIGAAAIVSQPISYLLGIIRDRPGLSASLISVMMFSAGAIGSGIFALGTTIGSYRTVAILGAATGLVGAALLLGLEGVRLRALGEERPADGS